MEDKDINEVLMMMFDESLRDKPTFDENMQATIRDEIARITEEANNFYKNKKYEG